MISIQHTSFHLYFYHLTPGYYLVLNYKRLLTILLSFPGDSAINNLPGNSGVSGSIPGLGRSPGEENDNPLQYSCLGKFQGQRSLGGSSPLGGTELDMTQQLNTTNNCTVAYNQVPLWSVLYLAVGFNKSNYVTPLLRTLQFPTDFRIKVKILTVVCKVWFWPMSTSPALFHKLLCLAFLVTATLAFFQAFSCLHASSHHTPFQVQFLMPKTYSTLFSYFAELSSIAPSPGKTSLTAKSLTRADLIQVLIAPFFLLHCLQFYLFIYFWLLILLKSLSVSK